jgi:L-fuculose-phosphate aldolase
MSAETALRQEMVRIGRLLYDRQLIVAAEGNLSCRLGGDAFLITPSGVCKGFLKAEDLLVVDAEGRPAIAGAGRTATESLRMSIPPRPSSEWLLHREIYAIRPGVAAVCHGHPPWATAFAAAGQALDACLLPEIVATLGRVPLAPYGTPGTAEVPRAVHDLIAGHDALLLANHGVVAVGTSLQDAFFRLESVERMAQIMLLARLAGGESRLTATQAAAVRALAGDGDPAAMGLPVCVPAEEPPTPATRSPERAEAAEADLDDLAERLAREILAELRRSP